MAFCSSETKNVSLWKSFHLDDIVDQGDSLVKYFKGNSNPFGRKHLFGLKIESCNIRVRKRMLYSDIFKTIYFLVSS